MEWLEFNRWSHEVEQRLADQATRLNEIGQPRQIPAPPQPATTQVHQFQTLLRQYPRTNPWGHPSAEC